MRVTRQCNFSVILLLHLVGVSTHFGPHLSTYIRWNETGVQRVQSSMIPLETSDPSFQHIDEILQLHWLEDLHDHKCLDAALGFSHCGPSSLWKIVPANRRHARRRQWIRWATEQDDVDMDTSDQPLAYALQLADGFDTIRLKSPARNVSVSALLHADDFQRRECLSRRRKDNSLLLVPCAEDRAWFWKINENGILHFDKPLRGSRSDSRKNTSRKRLLKKQQTLDCMWRKGSQTMLHPCDGQIEGSGHTDGRAIQLQFVRLKEHRTTNNAGNDQTRLATDQNARRSTSSKGSLQYTPINHETRGAYATLSPLNKVPSQVDIAHVHASTADQDPKERRSKPISTTFLPHQSPGLVAKELPKLLDNSNPILMISEQKPNQSREPTGKPDHVPSMLRDGTSVPERPMVRKIQMNPYIASSTQERWTDPQTGELQQLLQCWLHCSLRRLIRPNSLPTGLVYRTDLCEYLGHERKETGRHTLTGVGQYTKTMLNIKVRSRAKAYRFVL